MQARTDGKRYELEAVVDAELCASCGICVGSCPTATPFRRKSELIPGIDLPRITASTLKQDIDKCTAEPTDVLSFACSDSDELAWLRKHKKPYVEVACTGQIPPSYLDYVLSRQLSKRILLTGCGSGCRYRFGDDWSEQRIARTRDPNLRRRVGAYRISMAWQETGSLASQMKKLEVAAREDES